MKKILLVHEARLVMRLERTALQRRDYQIYTASTGFIAFETAQEKLPDLVVFDAVLSDMDGAEFCRMLRRDPRTRHISLLVLLHGDDVGVERFMKAGANDCLRMPMDRIVFNQHVTSLLDIPARKTIRTLVKLEVEGNAGRGAFFGSTINLSSSGMLLETTEMLEQGQSLRMSFFLPGSEEALDLRGEVVRRAGELPSTRAGYGIRFHPPARDQKRIERFVAEFRPGQED